MTFVHRHFDRCRHDHPVLCATVGVGVYGTLGLTALVHAALAAVWP